MAKKKKRNAEPLKPHFERRGAWDEGGVSVVRVPANASQIERSKAVQANKNLAMINSSNKPYPY